MRLVAGFCVAAALLVAACSGDDDDTVSSNPDASTLDAGDSGPFDDEDANNNTTRDSSASDSSQGTDSATDSGNVNDSGNDATSDGGNDAGTDAGNDAATDAGNDAATDAGNDAGNDASADAGNDAAADAGDDAAADAGSDAGLDPSFTNVYTTIINGTCTGCHSAAGHAGGLDMSTQATAYTNLVNVKAAGGSCGPTGETRVVPNSSATSLLFNKVNGTQDCGARMPRGQPALSADKITLIKNWIDTGALNN